MKAFFVLALLLAIATIIVAAVVFKSTRAVSFLKVLRRIAWGYIIGIVILAAWRIWSQGGI
ncbi:MAG: hypothetical protein Kow0010_04370 [Dehalococcoidia bacterium]